MKKELINFKGVNEGLIINIMGDDLQAVRQELAIKIKSAAGFYQGIKILDIKAEDLSAKDIKELKLILKYKFDLDIEDREEVAERLEEEKEAEPSIPSKDTKNENVLEGTLYGMTKFFHGTVRSGQVIEYNGNIVIIGDVNPGALIEAKGNIIVLGSFRGVGHAGADGNLKAIVAAYNLQPMQLRIGDLIARPPDNLEGSYKVPELAKVKQGEVVIEPYLPNK